MFKLGLILVIPDTQEDASSIHTITKMVGEGQTRREDTVGGMKKQGGGGTCL